MFEKCPILQPLKSKFAELFEEFSQYKSSIAAYGCIILNRQCDKFVLCKSYNGHSWSFPRGKVNENESAYDCAIRETLEETGYDASLHSNANHFVTHVENDKQIRLYIVLAVDENYPFAPLTRCGMYIYIYYNLYIHIYNLIFSTCIYNDYSYVL